MLFIGLIDVFSCPDFSEVEFFKFKAKTVPCVVFSFYFLSYQDLLYRKKQLLLNNIFRKLGFKN